MTINDDIKRFYHEGDGKIKTRKDRLRNYPPEVQKKALQYIAKGFPQKLAEQIAIKEAGDEER